MAIKRVGIKNSSGVYEYTDIAVDGSNVEMASGNDLETDLSSMKTDIDNKVAKVEGKGLSTEDYTSAEKDKLSGIEAGAQVNTVTGVKGDVETSYRQGQVNITPANIGAAPINHAASALTHGGGTADNYGHVKLSDNYEPVLGGLMGGRPASLSIGASERAVIKAYADLKANTMPDMKTIGAHNSIWRGEELLMDHFLDLNDLSNAVANGDFSDIYIGDTITVQMTNPISSELETVVWVVMGINIYYEGGSPSPLRKNHLVLVPKNTFELPAEMNSTNTTGKSENSDNTSNLQAYAGSDMFNITLPLYQTAIKNSLMGNVITTKELLANTMDGNKFSGGFSGWNGASCSWDWYNSTVSLLNEVEVFGTRIVSSSMYDVGRGCMQLPGFSLNPALKMKRLGNSGGRHGWWLSAVANNSSFVFVDEKGVVTFLKAHSQTGGIVPKVLFGA